MLLQPFKRRPFYKALLLPGIVLLLTLSCGKSEPSKGSAKQEPISQVLAVQENVAYEKPDSVLTEKEKEKVEELDSPAAVEPSLQPQTAEKAADAGQQTSMQADAALAEAMRLATLNVPPPVISGPAPGVYLSSVTVTISTTIKEAKIVYSLDGSNPDPKNSKHYTAPITLSESTLVKAIAYVPGGRTSGMAQSEYGIAEICVAAGGTGDGRRRQPMGDLRAAISKADSLGIALVKLGNSGELRGSYELKAAVSLSGGWNKDFSFQEKKPTVIKGDDQDSSSKKAPAFALKVSGSKVDGKVRLDRLDLRGGEATYSAGLLVIDGASPTITNIVASGGDSSYGYGAAVINNAAPDFKYSSLSGGLGASSYGLSVDSARATVAYSFLLAGSGMVSGNGLSATDAKIKLSSSVAAGNSANVSYGVALYNCKEARLESSTIVGGSGRDAAGIFISVSNPQIENCIISSTGSQKSYGIIANYGNSAPDKLAYTIFLGSSGGLYYDADSRTAYTNIDSSGAITMADGKSLARPATEHCAKAGFSLDATNGYRTPSSSGMPAAKVLGGEAATDILGIARSQPWTIGAYQ